jgi:hypothetical protein
VSYLNVGSVFNAVKIFVIGAIFTVMARFELTRKLLLEVRATFFFLTFMVFVKWTDFFVLFSTLSSFPWVYSRTKDQRKNRLVELAELQLCFVLGTSSEKKEAAISHKIHTKSYWQLKLKKEEID